MDPAKFDLKAKMIFYPRPLQAGSAVFSFLVALCRLQIYPTNVRRNVKSLAAETLAV